MTRRVLLLTHTGREDACEVALACCRALSAHGIVVRMPPGEMADLGISADDPEIRVEPAAEGDQAGVDCELALVLGGDGSILRAAEVTHATGTPLLGVNLGHVGFLAEAEHDDVESTIEAVASGRYAIEERTTLDVRVVRDGEVVTSTFALNEASVEKAARERMLEVVTHPFDERPEWATYALPDPAGGPFVTYCGT